MRNAAKNSCLVLAPANQPTAHAALFTRMAQALDFDLVRMDLGTGRGASILHSSFVLADVSGNDPETMYGIGVAHTFGKRVFVVTDAIERLPYDLASSRAWLVDPASDNEDIVRAMAQFLSVPYVIGPVRIFLGKFAFFGENLIARRFVAFLIDALLLLLLMAVVLYFTVPATQATGMDKLGIVYRELTQGPDNVSDSAIQTVVYSSLYVMVAYFAVATWLLGATLGQFLTGLRVVQADYRRATFGQCVGRSFLSVLVILTYGAAFLSAMRGPSYRAVHDLLSGTIVVRKKAA